MRKESNNRAGCAKMLSCVEIVENDEESAVFFRMTAEKVSIHPFRMNESELIFRMVKDVYYGKTLRKSFARYEEILEMPNLLEVQKNSYQWFWTRDCGRCSRT